MLEFLRQQVKSPIFQAIIIMIVLVFLFWVPQMGNGGSRDAIAVVNGDPISLSQYNADYNRMVDRLREQFQGNLPPDFIKTFGVKNQVLQRLIREQLLLQGAAKMGIHVSDWEVQEQIKNQAIFINDGVFDKKKYHNLLAQNKFPAKKYEANQRLDILTRKATEAVAGFATLSKWEVTTRYQYYLNEMKLDYGVLTPDLFKDQVEISAEKLNAYFAKHKEEYKTAPEIKLSYLHFSLRDAMDAIKIDDATINSYYETNKANYATPEQRKARHILLKTDGSNDAEQKKKAEDLLKQVKDGGDFAALARKFSDDPGSGSKGGELGTFAKGQMVPAFEEAVFALDEGQLSGLVKTRFGYHIIQLQDIIPAKTTPINEVRATITATIKQGQAKGKAFSDAGEAYEKIFQAGSLANYAKEENITLLTTDFFTEAKPAVALAGHPQVIAKAFKLKKGELSSMIESAGGYYILYIKDTIEPKVPELASVHDDVVTDFTHAEATKIAKDTASAILSIAREEGLQATLSAKNIEIKTSPWFSRQQTGSSNLPANVTSAAFSLSAENKYPKEVIASNDSFYVIGLAEIKVTETNDDSQLEPFKKALLKEKQMALLDSWLEHMHANSKIRINKEFMER